MPRIGGTRQPSLNGRMMVDTFRGQLRVRAWPRKRGPNVHPNVKKQNDWFREANRLAKIADASQQVLAIERTKKSGLYPRDVLMRAMTAGLYDVVDDTGRLLQPKPKRFDDMAFAGFSLLKTSNQTIPGGTNTGILWGDQVLDALGWLDIADPQYVEVPAGVAVAQFTASIWPTTSVNGVVICGIWKDGGGVVAEARSFGNGAHRVQAITAPLPVAAGDRFRVIMWSTANNVCAAVPSTFFGGNVLATSLT